MLKFFGRGSGFSDCHNSAYFVDGNDLVIIDFSMTSFAKFKKIPLQSYSDEYVEETDIDNIYVLITHTHGDHICGLGILCQYAYFALKRKITIVAPSTEVKNDLICLIERIEGCTSDWYNIITTDELNKNWFKKAVVTNHVPSLAGRCFGYILEIHGKNSIYTGDSSDITPFKEYITPGSVLYSEVALNDTAVHIVYNEVKDLYLDYINQGTEVYLMHMDDEKPFEELIKGTGIKLAPLA